MLFGWFACWIWICCFTLLLDCVVTGYGFVLMVFVCIGFANDGLLLVWVFASCLWLFGWLVCLSF